MESELQRKSNDQNKTNFTHNLIILTISKYVNVDHDHFENKRKHSYFLFSKLNKFHEIIEGKKITFILLTDRIQFFIFIFPKKIYILISCLQRYVHVYIRKSESISRI